MRACTALRAISERSAALNLSARAVAPFLPISESRAEDKALALAFPPSFPSDCAATFFFMQTILPSVKQDSQQESERHPPFVALHIGVQVAAVEQEG